jgi:hypothetical protein
MHDMQRSDDGKAEMERALAAYSGPVTRCPPGKPRAPRPPALKPMSKAVAWLKVQPGRGWPKDETPEARRERCDAERAGIAARNEVVRKRHGLRKSEVG